MRKSQFGTNEAASSDTFDMSRVSTASQHHQIQAKLESETKSSAKTELTSKSEFALQVEKERELVETTSHELYVKRMNLGVEFKKLEEDLKRDRRSLDKVLSLRGSIDSLLEHVSNIFRQNSKLFTKMLEKDANYKRQTVAMIMNLEANMKNYKSQKETPEESSAGKQNDGALHAEQTEVLLQKLSAVLHHKEQIIRKTKDLLSKKSKQNRLLLFRQMTEKTLLDSVITNVIEKSCFAPEAFQESIDRFKHICQEQQLEFKLPSDAEKCTSNGSQARILKESSQTATQVGFLKMMAEKSDKIKKQTMIYEQQLERIAKLEEYHKKLQDDVPLPATDANKGEESENELRKLRNNEKAKVRESINRDRAANEKLHEEILKLKTEVFGIFSSIASKNKSAIKMIKRQLVSNDFESPNSVIQRVFIACIVSPEELSGHVKKIECSKMMTGLNLVENFFKNRFLSQMSQERVKINNPQLQKKLKQVGLEGKPNFNGVGKLKLEQNETPVSPTDLKVNLMKLRDLVATLVDIKSDPEITQAIQDLHSLESKMSTKDADPHSNRSLGRSQSLNRSNSKQTNELNARLAKIDAQLRDKVERLMPIVYDFFIVYAVPEPNKKRSQPNSKTTEMAHILIKNLSERLAECKIERVEAENQLIRSQEKLQEEVNKLSVELNKKTTELQQALVEKTKHNTKVEHYTQSIQKLGDELLFERSRVDQLRKQISQADGNRIKEMEEENKRLKAQLVKFTTEFNDSIKVKTQSNLRRSLTGELDRDPEHTSKSVSNLNPKVENYFKKIKEPHDMSLKIRGEVRRPIGINLQDTPSKSRESFGSSEIRATPRFNNNKFDFKTQAITNKPESDDQANLYSIYHKHFNEVPKIMDSKPKPKRNAPVALELFKERASNIEAYIEDFVKDMKSKTEVMCDKFNVLKAILTKTTLIVEIFRSRSSGALVNLIESTFSNLPQPQPNSQKNQSADDLFITARLLRTENLLLITKIKVLERENLKLKDLQTRTKVVSSSNFESTSRNTPIEQGGRPVSKPDSTRRLEIFEPQFSIQSSNASIEVQKKDIFLKPHENTLRGTMNFGKRKPIQETDTIYQVENSFSNDLTDQKGKKRKTGSRESDHAAGQNFSFSQEPRNVKFKKQGRPGENLGASVSSDERKVVNSKNHSSEDGGSYHELNLYGALKSRQADSTAVQQKITLYNFRAQNSSNNDIDEQDLDESDGDFFPKVIENFFPESNEESYQKEREREQEKRIKK